MRSHRVLFLARRTLEGNDYCFAIFVIHVILLNRIKDFIVQFTTGFFVPHLEQLFQQTNANVTNARKGKYSSIFSGAKKWLSAPKAQHPPTHTRMSSADISALMSLEMQTRKLADLAFFLQQYEFAFNTYHVVKKECNEKMHKLFASCQVSNYRIINDKLNLCRKCYPFLCSCKILPVRTSCDTWRARYQPT